MEQQYIVNVLQKWMETAKTWVTLDIRKKLAKSLGDTVIIEI